MSLLRCATAVQNPRNRFELHCPREPGFLCAVSKLRLFVKYWLPILLWFTLIFGASSDASSVQHSSRLIGPLVRWLFPHLAEASVGHIVYFVRKCAHLTEYAILALLFWRAFRKPVKADTRPWSWIESRNAWLGVVVYASTDEIHQRFVPGRQGSFYDVLIDSTGGALGLLALWAFGRWRKLW